MRDLLLVKLGGSLITEKGERDTPRPRVIRRAARELAEALPAPEAGVLLGHGSGSFGHPAAEEHGLQEGLDGPEGLQGVLHTRERAAALHRIVLSALREAGLPAYSLAPSSAAVARGGELEEMAAGPAAAALSAELLPVTYGDVVLDRERGATVCSTESVLEALSAALEEEGWRARRALWFGDTGGVYDPSGDVVPRIDPAGGLDPAWLGSSADTDVTGGMAHRVEVALRLARRGVGSWIGSGEAEGSVRRAVSGSPEGGTRVEQG